MRTRHQGLFAATSLVVMFACGGKTPEPTAPVAPVVSAHGPFANGDVVAYDITDSSGKVFGRAHSRFIAEDGRQQVVTRLSFGVSRAESTVEYATTLRDDRTPVSFKRLSSADGRYELRFAGGFISVVTDIAERKVAYTPDSAVLVPKHDLAMFAIAVDESGLEPGQSGQVKVRSVDTGAVESWLTQVYVDGDGKTVVRAPWGVAKLDASGRVGRFESDTGWVFVARQEPGDPPALLPLPDPARYDRPTRASWSDRDVIVDVEGGQLSGTVSMPQLRAKWSSGLVPGVIFASDLFGQNRHGFTEAYDLGTWQILDRLAEEGFAVLRVDDRSVGSSRSDLEPSALRLAQLVAGLSGCVDALRRQPGVDADRIFVIGHGYGAIDALMLAARSELAGVVALAPAFRKPSSVIAVSLAAEGKAQAEAERLGHVLMVALGKGGAAQAQVPAELMRRYGAERMRLVDYEDLDVRAMLDQVEAPIAVFQGLKDFEVAWREDAQALVDAANKKRRGRAKLFPYEYADHLMKTEQSRSTPERYRDRGRRVEPRVLDDLVAWLIDVAKRPVPAKTGS